MRPPRNFMFSMARLIAGMLIGWRCRCGRRYWSGRVDLTPRGRVETCGKCHGSGQNTRSGKRVRKLTRRTDGGKKNVISQNLSTMTTPELFAELVRNHDEKNGGEESFSLIDRATIGCRYGDTVIRWDETGWRYGCIQVAYPTPAEAYANRRRDIAGYKPVTEQPSVGLEPTT